jgi:hypothetical protein
MMETIGEITVVVRSYLAKKTTMTDYTEVVLSDDDRWKMAAQAA